MSIKSDLAILESKFETLDTERKSIIDALREKEVEVEDTLTISEVDDKILEIESGSSDTIRVQAEDFEGETVTATLEDTVLTDTVKNGICEFKVSEGGEWEINLNGVIRKVNVDVLYETRIGKPVYLCKGTDFRNKLINGINHRLYNTITFDYSIPPEGATLYDVSRDNDNSIVMYGVEKTIYVTGYGGEIYANEDCSYMFEPYVYYGEDIQYYPSLKKINLDNFHTDSVQNMSYMFNQNSYLSELDVGSFNTENVTNMKGMFNYCRAIADLDVKNWNTSKVTAMDSMFHRCATLTSLDFEKWDTSKVTSMEQMFYYCGGLLSLDLSGFITSEIINLASMFYYCSELESLNLSKFDVSKVTTVNSMFYGCKKLEAIIAKDWTSNSNVTNSLSVFFNCQALPGWWNNKETGAYCKPIASGGYFTTP